jgi:prepilin-type N-terminal cleavage/methylation domain-containing protein
MTPHPHPIRPVPPPRCRSAFTLAEILVVVALLSMLLAFVTSFLVGLHRYDVKFRKGELRRAQLARLTETIRSDIRQGSTVSLPTDQSLLVTTSDGRETRYEIIQEGCRRTASELGVVPPMVDVFRIGPAESWTLDTGPPGRRPLYVVTVRSKKKAGGAPGTVSALVQAALGADDIRMADNTN